VRATRVEGCLDVFPARMPSAAVGCVRGGLDTATDWGYKIDAVDGDPPPESAICCTETSYASGATKWLSVVPLS
jgi:hypothetical protein